MSDQHVLFHLLLRERHKTPFHKVWEVSLPDYKDLPSAATFDTDSEAVFILGQVASC